MSTDRTKSAAHANQGAGRLSVDDAVALPQVEAWLQTKVDAAATSPAKTAAAAETTIAADSTNPEVAAAAVGAAKLANTALTSSALPTLRRRARKSGDRKAG